MIKIESSSPKGEGKETKEIIKIDQRDDEEEI